MPDETDDLRPEYDLSQLEPASEARKRRLERLAEKGSFQAVLELLTNKLGSEYAVIVYFDGSGSVRECKSTGVFSAAATFEFDDLQELAELAGKPL